MLAAGIEAIGLRYLLAMGVAYIVFLSLLWVWLRTIASDYLDGITLDGSGANESGGTAADFAGGGGTFVKRTFNSFVLTTVVVNGAGWAMQVHAPEARSLGDVIARR